jgi:hypothetical protein
MCFDSLALKGPRLKDEGFWLSKMLLQQYPSS